MKNRIYEMYNFNVYLLVVPEKYEQAGAELCQAQEKLGLAKPAVPRKKMKLSYIALNLRSSYIKPTIEVVFHLP